MYGCQYIMGSMSSVLLSNKASDARAAMAALISSRSFSIREDEPDYPAYVAKVAWEIADAMADEYSTRRAGVLGGPK